jgi:hypothetical protein
MPSITPERIVSSLRFRTSSLLANAHHLYQEYLHRSAIGMRLATFHGTNQAPRNTRVIISLTSIPSRLLNTTTCLAISSLLHQSHRPDKVILWVDERFRRTRLPSAFEYLQMVGLEIRYCPDVGPHTKLVYALEAFPESVIVTADDDRLYPPHWLRELWMSYQQSPQVIHCHRGHWMTFDQNGKLSPYNHWQLSAAGKLGPSHLLFQTGTGGVLYPPSCLHKDATDAAIFTSLCPKNDDIWFKAMALLNDTRCQKVSSRAYDYPTINRSQAVALWDINQTENDRQMQAVMNYYQLDPILAAERDTVSS